ncbi:hypothetical protein [Streptomyces sp. B6B3]|uniref:hypothetical protein n=1 Tax=Streptomyces sp. B6B3 TaxID=3153570 RepID=UPI00325DF6F2
MLAWCLIFVLGYLAVTLLTARAAYGVQRARLIERAADWHAGDDPVEAFEEHDQSSAATSAFLFGLAWPATVPGYCVYRCAAFVITTNPPEAPAEQESRAEQVGRRIEELEEEIRRPLDALVSEPVARLGLAEPGGHEVTARDLAGPRDGVDVPLDELVRRAREATGLGDR